jgi:hypothetical protein
VSDQELTRTLRSEARAFLRRVTHMPRRTKKAHVNLITGRPMSMDQIRRFHRSILCGVFRKRAS